MEEKNNKKPEAPSSKENVANEELSDLERVMIHSIIDSLLNAVVRRSDKIEEDLYLTPVKSNIKIDNERVDNKIQFNRSLSIETNNEFCRTSLVSFDPLDQGNPLNQSRLQQTDCFEIKCYRRRNVVTFLLFLGVIGAHSMRTTMVVTMDYIINRTAIAKEAESLSVRCERNLLNSTMINTNNGTIMWTQAQQSAIIYSFYYGYGIAQIPCGVLAYYKGTKSVLGIGTTVNALLCFSIPLVINYSYYLLMVIRFLQGLGEASLLPCVHSILANWSLPNERSQRVTFVYVGGPLGIIIMYPVSKYMASHPLLGGWPSIFFLNAGLNLLWIVLYFGIIYDEPLLDPTIQDHELYLITMKIWGKYKTLPQADIAWRSMFKSKPFWALMVAHFGQCYTLEMLTSQLPLFVHQMVPLTAYKGYHAIIIVLISWSFAMIISFLIDDLITFNKISIRNARNYATCIGFIGPAIFIPLISYFCDEHTVLTLLTSCLACSYCIYSGYYSNPLDLTPNFAGIIMAIINSFATIIILIFISLLDFVFNMQKKPSVLSWRIYYLFISLTYIICTVTYCYLSSGTRQYWDSKLPTGKLSHAYQTKPRRSTLIS